MADTKKQPEEEKAAAEAPKASEEKKQDTPQADPKELLAALAKALDGEAQAEKKANELASKAEALEGKLALAVKQQERLQGDFDNFRRRTRKEQAEAKEKMTADVVKEFLPVLDNFHLALSHMEKDPAGAAYVQGFVMLQKQLEKILADLGVAEIEAEGKPFDPHFHEAVMQVPSDTLPDESVASVFQKGYILKDHVIRPAKVQVVHNA